MPARLSVRIPLYREYRLRSLPRHARSQESARLNHPQPELRPRGAPQQTQGPQTGQRPPHRPPAGHRRAKPLVRGPHPRSERLQQRHPDPPPPLPLPSRESAPRLVPEEYRWRCAAYQLGNRRFRLVSTASRQLLPGGVGVLLLRGKVLKFRHGRGLLKYDS
jgi:hypothetical protein